MKKVILLLAYCLLPAAYCFAQDFDPPPKPVNPKPENPNSTNATSPSKTKSPLWSWDRVYVGGALGLQFGTFTLVNIAPDFGYKITEKFSAGIGIRYIYIADNTVVPANAMNIYGASVFSRYLITSFLFAHVEYEELNGPWTYYNNERSWLTNVWVGGGLRQHAGNASMNIMALWNLNQTPNNPFPSPQIRIGMSIGI